ncbi:hypothetical protein SAMN02949497_1833 [Methylomagnum ishizawai]|uniref:Uncharacterized protein n=1 Tax=Methylomagnum ishizawai TaxID=1760988 RepID=A0A1Y6D3G7_9GAMM|nr:hypothetical protein [Methylomagnum ishizawai]SMF94515.1 hypothetical protein SAMN02949497_1833 [Methylomagnum ishizawai]
MARAKTSKGRCAFCQQDIAKNMASRHFPACPAWKEATAHAEGSKRKAETLYHLRVQAEGQPEFWLDLEMRGSAKLKDLDEYLRAIWLECCGHMSQFSHGGWGGEELPMNQSLASALAGGELTHIYDFGTESISLIKPLDRREGKPIGKHPITLLIRNLMPPAACIECQEPATWLCMECLIDDETEGTLCDRHAQNHPHDTYGAPIHIVNSPRLGLCGYEGPADPPY